MNKKLFLAFFLLYTIFSQAQFEFSGHVNDEFENSTAYLTLIEDYNKSTLFLTETIIQQSSIDAEGEFVFKGDYLSEKNKFYKIYIDKCNENVNDYNHLLNHCDDSNYIIFIANNKDTIYFPLNDFSQMFCSIEYTRAQNVAIHKIDSVQETLLVDLQDSKSDQQRKLIYNNYVKKLQEYSTTFNEPLVELYAFQLYSDENSFSRNSYLENLKKSDYYESLAEKIAEKYPNSQYEIQFKEDIFHDGLSVKKGTKINYLAILLGILLATSLFFNYRFIQQKKEKKSTLNYKEALSPQEQKVFELMHQKLTNKEIAEQLFISVSTVKTHINNIYSKLSISSRKDIHQFF